MDVPKDVEAMTQELGAISELQTAKYILMSEVCTLGFDATTQEGIHINSIHVTSQSTCYSVAVDELAGGTAAYYHQHIVESVENLAAVYSNFNEVNKVKVKKQLISKISNSLTDRCAANHATIELSNDTWDKTCIELNCHFHPLETISTKTRTSLKKTDKEYKVQLL